jgi:hypothetical protein
LKDVAGTETAMTVEGDMITGAKCVTVVEYMKVKGAKSRNGIRNETKEVRREQCVVIRGYS